MADHPILFSAPMVRALLDGRKTQTRRILKPQPTIISSGLLAWERKDYFLQGTLDDVAHAQRIAIDDSLWVREAWRTLQKWDDLKPSYLAHDASKITYEADPENRNSLWAFGKLRPSMFMPRWASRLTLTITEVRVERLQDISQDDAVAEGVVKTANSARLSCGTLEWSIFSTLGSSVDGSPVSARDHYADLWNHINGPCAWQQNPFVVAYSFTVERKNIDEVAA